MKTDSIAVLAVVTFLLGLGLGAITTGISASNQSLKLCSTAAELASGSFFSSCSYDKANRRLIVTVPSTYEISDEEIKNGFRLEPVMKSWDLETREIIGE